MYSLKRRNTLSEMGYKKAAGKRMRRVCRERTKGEAVMAVAEVVATMTAVVMTVVAMISVKGEIGSQALYVLFGKMRHAPEHINAADGTMYTAV